MAGSSEKIPIATAEPEDQHQFMPPCKTKPWHPAVHPLRVTGTVKPQSSHVSWGFCFAARVEPVQAYSAVAGCIQQTEKCKSSASSLWYSVRQMNGAIVLWDPELVKRGGEEEWGEGLPPTLSLSLVRPKLRGQEVENTSGKMQSAVCARSAP
ncbi:hypothetical protein CCH79_00011368 [Gambusia affinis]|uniref:Uncharacterized protein n=1 Tax=Gambusia affinis TaxID=33528 RepID=A0A315V5T2_GAMAF|nr:hypothetical protein CCH79_00011368 [Gambusia affinis]